MISRLLTPDGSAVIELHGAFPAEADGSALWTMVLDLIESGYRHLVLDFQNAVPPIGRNAFEVLLSLHVLVLKARGWITLCGIDHLRDPTRHLFFDVFDVAATREGALAAYAADA